MCSRDQKLQDAPVGLQTMAAKLDSQPHIAVVEMFRGWRYRPERALWVVCDVRKLTTRAEADTVFACYCPLPLP